MKRLAFVLLLVAVSAFAAEEPASVVVVDTTDFRPGEAKVFTIDNSVRVTVSRTGETRHIRVERFGIVNEYRLEPVDGVLKVTRLDAGRGIAVSPHRIIIDGIPLDAVLLPAPRGSGGARYFICPKDETMVRVPNGHAGDLRCPIDGTVMRPGLGRSSSYFLLQ